MSDESISFLECTFIEQEVDALACGELSFLVLALAPFRPTTCLRRSIATLELFELLFEIHGRLRNRDYRRGRQAKSNLHKRQHSAV